MRDLILTFNFLFVFGILLKFFFFFFEKIIFKSKFYFEIEYPNVNKINFKSVEVAFLRVLSIRRCFLIDLFLSARYII